MLICPDCQFENPNNHKFCQNCGTSLNQRVCPECGVDVATNAEKCHVCGAVCGTVRTALIVKNNSLPAQKLEGESQKLENPELTESPTTPQPLMIGDYLDYQQRYQLLEPLPNTEELSTHRELCVRVLDCQPYQITPLKVILTKQSQDLPNSIAENSGNVPSWAQTYIALQPQLHKGIPPIHDAWQQDGMEVVLLEDRSHWQSLLQLWQEDSTTSLQILECFYRITQLWELLIPFDACSSLLELSNLRLDEDQSLALQRLYVGDAHLTQDISPDSNGNGEKSPITLQALGKSWHSLFSKSQRTQFGSMLNLLADLKQGKILSITDLQSRLGEIADEVQDSSSEPSHDNNDTQNVVEEEHGNIEKMPTSATVLQLEPLEENTAITDDSPTVNLPMQLSSLDDAGCTDVGKQRNHNEDCFGIETEISKVELPKSRNLKARGLYVLCDGMGDMLVGSSK